MRIGLFYFGFVGIAASIMCAAFSSPTAPGAALQSIVPWFEPNQGLYSSDVKYYSRGTGYTVALDDRGATLSLSQSLSQRAMRLALAGGNPKPAVTPAG